MAKTYKITIQHPRLVTFVLLAAGVVIIAWLISMVYHYNNYSGSYNSNINMITIYGKDFDLGTLEIIGIHEASHKFWFKDMTQAQRDEYELIFNGANTYVTDYAKTNAAEDFADTIAYNTICDLDTTRISEDRRQFLRDLSMPGIIKIIGRPDKNN